MWFVSSAITCRYSQGEENMIKVTFTRKAKPCFAIYFKTIQDAKAFTEFERELIENIKKKEG
jgi:hypothetical protein